MESGAFGKLHRAFRDFVENIGGGYVGGGGNDPESAMIALETLVNLIVQKDGTEADKKQKALNVVETHSAPGMTPLHQLLERYKLDKTLRDYQPRESASGQVANGDVEEEALTAVNALLKLSYPGTLTLEGHDDTVRDVAVSKDGTIVVTGSDDKTVRVWNAKTGEMKIKLGGDRSHRREVFGVAISPDGKTAVSSSLDKICKVWDLTTDGEASKERELRAINVGARVDYVAMHPDGRSFFTGDGKGRITRYETDTGKEMARYIDHTGYVVSIAVTSTGEKMVSGSKDTNAIVWNARTGAKIHTLSDHEKWVQSVALTPDNRR